MAASANAERRLVARPSGGHVAFAVGGIGPVILMIPSLGRGVSDFLRAPAFGTFSPLGVPLHVISRAITPGPKFFEQSRKWLWRLSNF
jgi:hypothetical protein